MNVIPYGHHQVDAADAEAVAAVLRSELLTQGPVVDRFEEAMASYCGARYAVAVNSATSALHLACRALGVGPGDRGWTSPNTFVASANCLLYCGAQADFVDIDPATLNLSVAALEEKLRAARREGTLPKVVIPVDFAGRSCDMAAMRRLADEYGFRLIEDASHAVGGRYAGQPVGCSRWADVTVFSFHPVKNMTSGEGGLLLTNDEGLYRKLRLLRSHGITRDAAAMEGASEGGWYYEQIDLGYNYRMTDIHCALGLSQLAKLDRFIARRRLLARRYDERLAGLPLARPPVDDDSAWHIYTIRLADAARRKAVYDGLRAEGIGVTVHYIPVYWQPHYRRLGFARGLCPNAEHYYAGALTLPLYPGLPDEQQEQVIEALGRQLRKESAS